MLSYVEWKLEPWRGTNQMLTRDFQGEFFLVAKSLALVPATSMDTYAHASPSQKQTAVNEADDSASKQATASTQAAPHV